jgi:hypothetical protein
MTQALATLKPMPARVPPKPVAPAQVRPLMSLLVILESLRQSPIMQHNLKS